MEFGDDDVVAIWRSWMFGLPVNGVEAVAYPTAGTLALEAPFQDDIPIRDDEAWRINLKQGGQECSYVIGIFEPVIENLKNPVYGHSSDRTKFLWGIGGSEMMARICRKVYASEKVFKRGHRGLFPPTKSIHHEGLDDERNGPVNGLPRQIVR
jgi:hypothetical protein